MRTLRILFAGGGTGGHIFPLIAVAQNLKLQTASERLNLDMRYFGGDYRYKEEMTQNDIRFVPVFSSKLRRYWSILNILDILKFFLSIPQLLWKIFWFMPDVVFSKGGPGALAVVLVSKFYGIPIAIHESDSIPGLTNSLSGRLAGKIFLAFDSAAAYFKNKNPEIVGNPVRQSLLGQKFALGPEENAARSNARKEFGLRDDLPLIFVLGGSQGAGKLNDFILENLDGLLNEFQILHQTGSANYESYKMEYSFLTKDWSELQKARYVFRPFFSVGGGSAGDGNLAAALTAADIVITRAGSGSLFEIAAFGKPAIIVPLRESANDHQIENARIYAKSGAAFLISEENLLGSIISDTAKNILGNPEQYAKMSQAAQNNYRPEAASAIAKYILSKNS